jgi:hypothetical protein
MRTFIFGAGASVHAGYPLASELWRATQGWANAVLPESHDFRTYVRQMNEAFDLSRPFELVLTDLDDRIDLLTKKGGVSEEKVYLVYMRSGIATMLRCFFDSIRSHPAEVYRVFCDRVLTAGDAVITFNYDLALDREMRRSGKWSVDNGYGFRIDRPSGPGSSCLLLKLHGSTNWNGEIFEGSHGFSQISPGMGSLGRRPVIERSELEFLEYKGISDSSCHDRTKAKIESLIMPAAKKKFYKQTSLGREWEDFWDALWEQAGEALYESEEVHIIGYSVPEYDERARALLSGNMRPEALIKVCCHGGTGAVVEALTQLCTSNKVQPASATTFEGLVASF